MRIENLSQTTQSDRARISAQLIWEDCDRPPREIYVDTPLEFSDALTCNPNAFFLAAALPAMRHGEKRLRIDGKICPHLRNGLITAMRQFRRWYGEALCPSISFEPTSGFEPSRPAVENRTASFFSGGVDALATLRSNRLTFPIDHPASIKDCLFVYGFDLGCYENMDENLASFEESVNSFSELGSEEHFTLLPIYSNFCQIDDNVDNKFLFYFGAQLGGLAQAFSRRISTVHIASSDDVLSGMGPMGSHPLIDPYYSSSAVTVYHDGTRYSRLEKVGLIGEWENGLRKLRTCWDYFRPAHIPNCGECEKCLRTMTELLIFDKLKVCPVFTHNDVTPDQLRTLYIGKAKEREEDPKALLHLAIRTLTVGNIKNWRSLVLPLRKIGRNDLSDVIEEKLEDFDGFLSAARDRSWKGSIKRFDRERLGSALRKSYRMLHGKPKR